MGSMITGTVGAPQDDDERLEEASAATAATANSPATYIRGSENGASIDSGPVERMAPVKVPT